MASPALRVALAGCGRLGTEVFSPLLRTMPGIALVAVADADPAALATHRMHDPRVACCDDWRRIFDVPHVDAAIIALPSSHHADAAIECLLRGMAVYIEKPMATTIGDSERIAEAQRQSGATAMVGFNYRANPVYESLRAGIQGAPGPPRLIRTVFTTPRQHNAGWRVSHATGGGVLFDLASHHFDLVRFLTGLHIRDVVAASDGGCDGGERVSASLTLESGVPVSATFATGTIDQDQVEATGEGWSLIADRYQSLAPESRGAAVPGRLSSAMRTLTAARHAPYAFRKLREPWHEPSFRIALGRFFTAVRERRPVTPGLEDGVASLAAVLAARESIETGRRVAVAAARRDPPARPDPAGRLARPDQPDQPDRSGSPDTSGRRA